MPGWNCSRDRHVSFWVRARFLEVGSPVYCHWATWHGCTVNGNGCWNRIYIIIEVVLVAIYYRHARNIGFCVTFCHSSNGKIAKWRPSYHTVLFVITICFFCLFCYHRITDRCYLYLQHNQLFLFVIIISNNHCYLLSSHQQPFCLLAILLTIDVYCITYCCCLLSYYQMVFICYHITNRCHLLLSYSFHIIDSTNKSISNLVHGVVCIFGWKHAKRK